MKLITCLVDGALKDIDSTLLTPFRIETDNENENVVNVGWTLDGVVVQNNVHMTLKKAATYVDAVEGSIL